MTIYVTYPTKDGLGNPPVYGDYPSSDAVVKVSRASAGEVAVEFDLLDCPMQLGGGFMLSPDAARWLAGALLAAADRHTDRLPISATIKSDSISRTQ